MKKSKKQHDQRRHTASSSGERASFLKRFARENRGVAAVEFALIVPVMVSAYLGSVDLTQGIMVDRKVSLMTSAIGDLIAQSDEIDNADMNNIFNISGALMAPYDAQPIEMRVSSLEITPQKQGNKRKAKVLWSDGKNKTAYAVDTEILIPESIAKNATTVIYTEGWYTFTPLFGQVITSSLTMDDEYFHIPRVTDSVDRN